METVRETIDIEATDGTMAVVVFRPADAEPHPAVIMVHGAPGLTDGILGLAERLASEGFVTAAPDMFYRTGRLRTVSRDTPVDVRAVMQEGMTNEGDVADVDCIANWLVARDDVAGERVGITGFCMGGRIAYLGAAHCERIGASIMYYPTRLVTSEARGGSETRPPIDDIDKVRVPILGFFPTLDLTHCSPEVIAQVKEAFETAGTLGEVIAVEGANHGFLDPTSAVHDEDAAAMAWGRMTPFFAEHLGLVAAAT
jgi:carboxymethylenebutenolidase